MAGYQQAGDILQKRRQRRGPAVPEGFAEGRPVYGTPGQRFVPGRGIV